MATKQEVADYINSIDLVDLLNDTERAHISERITPYLAQALIKVVGDVSWLVEIRDNVSRDQTNRNL
tara:strand:+ start:231 stop:431 length:201 start_codon:yes stop_codon:yes gene_type:complete